MNNGKYRPALQVREMPASVSGCHPYMQVSGPSNSLRLFPHVFQAWRKIRHEVCPDVTYPGRISRPPERLIFVRKTHLSYFRISAVRLNGHYGDEGGNDKNKHEQDIAKAAMLFKKLCAFIQIEQGSAI